MQCRKSLSELSNVGHVTMYYDLPWNGMPSGDHSLPFIRGNFANISKSWEVKYPVSRWPWSYITPRTIDRPAFGLCFWKISISRNPSYYCLLNGWRCGRLLQSSEGLTGVFEWVADVGQKPVDEMEPCLEPWRKDLSQLRSSGMTPMPS